MASFNLYIWQQPKTLWDKCTGIIFPFYFFLTLLLYSKMHWLDVSNIARQYIHVSYTDVFNIFIVTTFTLNIFYIISYIDKQLPRHIELTVHQVAFNQEIHASFCFSCRSNSVCASFVRRFPCALKLSWKYDRYGISVLSFSPPTSSPQKSTKSEDTGASHWGRRGVVFNAPTCRLGRDH